MAELGRSDLVIGAILKDAPRAALLVVARAAPGWLRFHAGPVTYVGGAAAADALPAHAVAHVAAQTPEAITALDGLLAGSTRLFDVVFLHHALHLPHVQAQLVAIRPLCHPRTLLLVDGAAPPSVAMTGAHPTGGWFVGELWMLAHLLRPAASWGFVATVAVWPTGLLAATGAEPLDAGLAAAEAARLAAITDEAAFAAAQPNLPPDAFVARCAGALAAIDIPVLRIRPLTKAEMIRPRVEPPNHPARLLLPLDAALSLDTVSDAVLLGHGAVLCGDAIWSRDADAPVESMARGTGERAGLGTQLRWVDGAAWLPRAVVDAARPLEGAYMVIAPTDWRDWRCSVRQVIPAAAAYLHHAEPGTRVLADVGRAWQRRLLETLGVDPADIVPIEPGVAYACEALTVLRTPGLWAAIGAWECRVFAGLSARFGGGGGRATRFQVGPADAALLTAIKARGFGHIGAEAFAPHDRIALFAGAELVVAVGMAALIDVVFCRPGTRVIGCVAPGEVDAATAVLSALALQLTIVDASTDLRDHLPAP